MGTVFDSHLRQEFFKRDLLSFALMLDNKVFEKCGWVTHETYRSGNWCYLSIWVKGLLTKTNNLKKWALQARLHATQFLPYRRGWHSCDVQAQADGEGRYDRRKLRAWEEKIWIKCKKYIIYLWNGKENLIAFKK